MDNYKIVSYKLSAADIELLVLSAHEDYLKSRLSGIKLEKGLLQVSAYDDFLIFNFIANINDFMITLAASDVALSEFLSIRKELVGYIIESNPLLDPNVLYIGPEGGIHFKKDLKDLYGYTLITENASWPEDLYVNSINTMMGMDKRGDVNKNEIKPPSKAKNIKELPFEVSEEFWKRLNTYIRIKKFTDDCADIIFDRRNFDSVSNFEKYVVTVCVLDVEELFTLIDRNGLTTRVQAATLIHELYNLCRDVNPFADFSLYRQKYYTPDKSMENGEGAEEFGEDYDEVEDPFVMGPFAHKRNIEEGLKFGHRRRTKLFKDVEKDKIVSLAENMNKYVIGQSEAITQLSECIHRASVGLKDPDQPIGCFMFAGSSGIGKTETAKALSQELTGDRKGLVIIDCSEYSADHEYSKLIGSPSGYVGHDQGGYLTNAIRKNPFSVVLFDEIEKASEKVHQLLLQIMDEARLTDGRGRPTSFKEAIIIMTSNIGVKEVQDIERTLGFGNANVVTFEKKSQALSKALKTKFKPEFLNRLTSIINFRDLSKDDFMKIIELEFEKLGKNFKLNKTIYSSLELVFDKSLHEYVYEDGIDAKLGARPLKRIIEKKVSTPVAKKILSEEISAGSVVEISVIDEQLQINITETNKLYPPPFYMNSRAVHE